MTWIGRADVRVADWSARELFGFKLPTRHMAEHFRDRLCVYTVRLRNYAELGKITEGAASWSRDGIHAPPGVRPTPSAQKIIREDMLTTVRASLAFLAVSAVGTLAVDAAASDGICQ